MVGCRTFLFAVSLAGPFAPDSSTNSAGGTPNPVQSLTFRDVVEQVGRIEPTLRKARIDVDRAHLSALRAQLDRISITVNASVNELWDYSNIFGSTLYNCQVGTTSMQADPATCASYGGVSTVAGTQMPRVQEGFFTASAKAVVPLFTGFRLTASANRTELLQEAAAQSLLSAQRDLELSLVRAYWSVRKLGLLVDVQRKALARLADGEEVTTGRIAAGLAPSIDHNRAVLRRLQGQDTLADYAGQLQEANAQLATALGIGTDIDLVDNPDFPEAAPAPVDALLMQAQSRRPDLQAAHYERMAQEQAVRVARAPYFPDLDAFGLFQYGNNLYNTAAGTNSSSSSGAANPFKNMSGEFTAGLTVSWNIFNMFQTYTSTLDATYQLTQSQEEERRIFRAVEADLRVARAKVEHLAARLRALTNADEVAKDNVQILRNRYKNGDAMVIEYLDSEVELASAEQQLVGVTVELQIAWMELNLAVGLDAADLWAAAQQDIHGQRFHLPIFSEH
jgi:outer membrane protein